MNPSSRGWIKKYVSVLDKSQDGLNRFPGSDLTTEELVYSYVQPTGLLYGHPTKFIFLEQEYFQKLTPEESFKILLLEGLFLVEHLREGTFDKVSLEEGIYRFVDFYEKSNLEKAKKSWLDFSKLDVYGKLESIINQRVEVKNNIANKYIIGYLFNSLLFHDLLLYHDYKNNLDPSILVLKRTEFMLDIIKVIACAAQSDGVISDEEKSIFKLFLASANLESYKKNIAETYLNQTIKLADISFEFESSWLLKRYILEIAILTMWSDDDLKLAENNFLKALVLKLGLNVGEKDKSILAIQHFVLNNNHNKSPFFKGDNDIKLILSSTGKRWNKILTRNKDKLAHELKESKELVSLIGKSTHSELSKEEKEKVKSQLADLGKTIPALTLFMLPGGAIILPLVLKIIPNLIPSAFRENQIDDKDA